MAEDVQRPSSVGLGRRRLMEAAERRRADLLVQDDHRGVRVGPGILVIALEEEGLGSGRDRGGSGEPSVNLNKTGFYCADIVKQLRVKI